MDKPSYKLVGAPCGQHGQYTFYKALRLTGEQDRIIAIGDFFFVRIWQDSELVSIGELQLLWTDRVSDQTLVSLRLYFLPENTPDGRNLHGEDEVLAINEKVVLRAEDLLSWVCTGAGWRWGLRAVWRGACAPPGELRPTVPLHHTKLDFSDVEREKNEIALDEEHPGVVVFSYPRYCRYRALLSRLEGIQGDWLRHSLVAALGGYAAPTKNTRILYCKDTFEYPELEGHEFVCNHLAPKLKGRPRGRRRRRARSRSHSPSSRSSDSDGATAKDVPHENRVNTPRRLSLRSGAPEKQQQSEEDYDSIKLDAVDGATAEDKAFMEHLRRFYRDRNEPFKMAHSWKDLPLRALYLGVTSRGGYEAVCRLKLWRNLNADQPARVRRHYERFLLQFENHERKNGSKTFLKIPNGKIDLEPNNTIDTIDVTDSPLRDIDKHIELPEKRLRTPSPNKRVENVESKPVKDILDNETGEITSVKEELNITSKPAEELNREFLESLPKEEEKPLKISVKPVEKLIEPIKVITDVKNNDVVKLFEDNSKLLSELAIKHSFKDSSKMITDIGDKQLAGGNIFLSELAQKLNLGNTNSTLLTDIARAQQEMHGGNALTSLSSLGDKYAVNGHAHNGAGGAVDPKNSRPVGRSSLRAVRVKPTRPLATAPTPPVVPLRPHSASSSPPQLVTPAPPAVTSAPPITNFGIHHPPPTTTCASHSDDEIVEVPYKPKTPEIIDLDEYPESPQAVKKKKLDILKERGLEVTAIPTNPTWPGAVATPSMNPITPLINPPIMLNPAVQHQIMTQAQIFQMYNIIPPNYVNGIQPPRIIQAPSIFGSSGPEKTVYGNPKDPFMPPPHIIHGAPVKPQRSVPTSQTPAQDILDLTCKTSPTSSQKPAVEIVRIPTVPSPTKVSSAPQNLSKNYTLIDGKAVVGSNLEITLVNPKAQTPVKSRPPQKRSSNGKFVSAKTPTPPKDYPKPYPSPSPSGVQKKTPIVVPNYQINSTRDDVSPTSSTGSRDSQTNLMQSVFKSQNSLAQIMEMQKTVPSITPFMDPMYMSALYSSLAGQLDQRQLAMYRDLMANQMRSYPGLLNLGAVTNTPTTKN